MRGDEVSENVSKVENKLRCWLDMVMVSLLFGRIICRWKYINPSCFWKEEENNNNKICIINYLAKRKPFFFSTVVYVTFYLCSKRLIVFVVVVAVFSSSSSLNSHCIINFLKRTRECMGHGSFPPWVSFQNIKLLKLGSNLLHTNRLQRQVFFMRKLRIWSVKNSRCSLFTPSIHHLAENEVTTESILIKTKAII